MSKYGKYTGNQIESVLNKIGGEEAIDYLIQHSYRGGVNLELSHRLKGYGWTDKDIEKLMTTDWPARLLSFIRGEDTTDPKRRWREENGVILFPLTSDGTTGPEWIKRLEQKGFRLSQDTKRMLDSPDFKPTNGVTSEIAVLKGMLFQDSDRITEKIRAEGKRRHHSDPNAEIACLIREKFSDEELEAMGLWWITAMHKPIADSGGGPDLLSAGRDGGGHWLDTCYGRPGNWWDRGSGFAFVVSQVSALGC